VSKILRSARLAAFPLAAVLLVGFHLNLLWERIAAATLFEPVTALRWGAALLLMAAALYASRRLGFSLWHGRGALVFWLMVLLLHSGAAIPVAKDLASEVDLLAHASVLFVLPVLVTLVSLALLGLGWPAALAANPPPKPCGCPRRTPDRSASFDDEGGFARRLASLPPPALAA
jgi:hypothetical protein